MTEGDTWLVDTLNLCQLLQGRALDREPGKVSLKLRFCFLFSPHLSPPLSLLSSIFFSLSIPSYLPCGVEMLCMERTQRHSTSDAGCSLI